MNTPANSTASTPSEALQGLPRFDLQQWHNTAGDAAERQTMAESLCQACHDVGFFLLTNHGIDSALIDAVFDLSARASTNVPRAISEAGKARAANTPTDDLTFVSRSTYGVNTNHGLKTHSLHITACWAPINGPVRRWCPVSNLP
jgi:hypothetical protein